MKEIGDIRAIIHAYKDFSECLLEALEWSNFGTTIQLQFDYIWRSDGSVRSDSSDRVIVSLSMTDVRVLEVHNPQPLSLSSLNWSAAEVSWVMVSSEAENVESSHSVPLHRLSVRREDGPWIDIVFAELEVGESSAPPLLGGEWQT